MLRNGSMHKVNLNQPGYAAQLLSHLLDGGLDFGKKATHEFDGNQLLLDMGYTDTDNYLR